MRKISKIMALLMVLCMAVGIFAGCNAGDGSSQTSSGGGTTDTSGVDEIYFLNFKPEIADKYEAIAAQYEEETGIKVKITTAASGEYEKTLMSEIAKSDPPTIFQINGPVGYQNWKDYCADLKDSELYNMLTDENKSLAVSNEDGIYGIPYALEGYGIIYNNAIMEAYFASENKSTNFTSVEEITNFAALSEIVEDMTKLKDELGIDGVFASTSMAEGNQWRWQTHLANLPLYYEFKENTDYDNVILAGLNTNEIKSDRSHVVL